MRRGTEVLKVASDGSGSPELYRRAATCLRAGGLVAFPTETVYGLGGDVSNQNAIDAIFEVKERPGDNPLIVHVGDVDQARAYCLDPHGRLAVLAEAFWPGPLTLVLKADPASGQVAGRGLDTVALRIPAHPVARRLIQCSGLALAAPSANRSGRPSPTRADHVLKDLGGRIPIILDGGPCEVGIESTVVDVSGEEVRILRPGQIDEKALAKVLASPVGVAADEAAKRHSPGTRYRHYRPKAPVWVVGETVDEPTWLAMVEAMAGAGIRWGYAGWRNLSPKKAAAVVPMEHDPVAYARDFYRVLRHLDEASVALILIDGPRRETGVGMALWDRLNRASEGELESLDALRAVLERKNPPGA